MPKLFFVIKYILIDIFGNKRVTDKIHKNGLKSRLGVFKEIIQENIEKEQQIPKTLCFWGFLYCLKFYEMPQKHTKFYG